MKTGTKNKDMASSKTGKEQAWESNYYYSAADVAWLLHGAFH